MFETTLTQEFLFKELIKNKKSTAQVARENNTTKSTVIKYYKKAGLTEQLNEQRKNRSGTSINLLGQKFGQLTVKDVAAKDKHHKFRWLCLCNCGKEKIINAASLMLGLSTSCGFCERVNFTGFKDISGVFWRKFRDSGLRREYEFDIDLEYVWNIYEQQGRKCALSNLPIKFHKNYDNPNEQTASIDRVNSNLGYVQGNIQIIHKRLNRIKTICNNKEFIAWCHAVASNTKNTYDKDLSKVGWYDY